MDDLTIVLRVLHIAFGTFWAGTVFFSALILEPSLRRMGPNFQNPVMNTLMPVITPLMMLSSLIVLGTGIAMTFMLWSSLDTFLSSTSDWILFIGFLLTIGAAVVGFGFLAPTGMKLSKLTKSFEGQNPDSDKASQLTRLTSRIETLSRLNFILILLAVCAMGFLRYL